MQHKTFIFQSIEDEEQYLVWEPDAGKMAILRATPEQARQWLDKLREDNAQVGAA